jgi:uncharacterized protein YbaP (TraB family)
MTARLRDLVYRLLAAVISVHLAIFAPLAVAAHSEAPETATSENPCLKQVYQDISKLILEFYPKAKVVGDGYKIHFEYKAHPYTSVYSNLAELAPENGGILGDIELKPGKYAGNEPLPHEQNQYRYNTLLMAPFSQKHNCQLYSALSYPPDALTDFLERYKDVINNFDSELVGLTGPIAFTKAPATDKSSVTSSAKPADAPAVISTPPNSTPSTSPTPPPAVATATTSASTQTNQTETPPAISTTTSNELKQAIELNNKATGALSKSNFSEAISQYIEALQLAPDYGLCRDNLAVACNNYGLSLRDQPATAIRWFERSLFLNPGNTTTIENMGAIMNKLGMSAESFDDHVKLGDERMAKQSLIGAVTQYRLALKIKQDDGVAKKLAAAMPNTTDSAAQKQALVTILQDIGPQAVQGTASKTAAQASSWDQATKPNGHPLFLWRATRGKEVVYLLGTIHVATPKLYPMPLEIDQAFDESKLLIVEVAIDRRPVDPAAMKKLVETAGTYTPPDKLSNHMSPATKKIFEDYLTWSGESWPMFERYKPWYVRELTAASMPVRDEMRNLRSGLGIDRYLLGRAKATHKDVGEFETVDFQLGLFSKLPEDVQDKLLQVSLLDVRNAMSSLNDAFAAWKTGDTAKMYNFVNKIVQEHPDLAPYNKILLDDRNKGMAARLEEIMKTKQGPYFVAVGSGHMVGDSGLVSLLQKQGFSVQQIYAQNRPGDNVTSASTANLKKFAFPNEKFRVWMPAAPQRKDLPGAEPKCVQYMFAEFGGTAGASMSTTFGMFAVFSFEFPTQQYTWKIPGPLALDMMLGPLTSIKGAETLSRHSIILNNEYAGREIEFIAPTRTAPDKASGGHTAGKQGSSPIPQSSFASDLFGSAGGMSKTDKLYGKARAYVAGNHIYMLITAGDTPGWTKTQKVDDFLNSFDVLD